MSDDKLVIERAIDLLLPHAADPETADVIDELSTLQSERASMEGEIERAIADVMEAAKGGGVACQTRIYAALKPLIALTSSKTGDE